MSGRLRVVIASYLGEKHCARIEQIEPRVQVICDQSLLRPPRFPGDHRGDPTFARSAQQQARFLDLVDSADALYGLPDESPAGLRRTVDANPRLRWVHTTRAGGGEQVKAAELDDNSLQRVAFTTSAGVHADPLAEFAVLGVLAGAKNLDRLQALQRRHEWALPWAMGRVSRQRAVVIGLGAIGRAVAAKLDALGADVIGVHRRPIVSPGLRRVVPVSGLATVLPTADSVIMALPATASTFQLFDRQMFSVLKAGATFVNVGRGTTVDEDELINALCRGQVGFAALDVFSCEPLPISSRLWELPNVIISPHSASSTTEEDGLIAELFADNASRLLDDAPMRNIVNTDEFY
ncbi:D-2-hydroxyacid dehydrogenase [Rhodococcus sp. JS3073]|uniref:D-2-hydroxyacid dehydrogenase n=1 Tax=Rhodococcus sp. JS3073 TaxID=3002901 RepID=UPI0022863A53|nr:D-2-hydroxyacid dehydrogenase [Rhodococcus sp. JS3073]WAM19898.1 D-2-hydroxyacid dehydrogenase [Rhodococcus sp. JS3073]